MRLTPRDVLSSLVRFWRVVAAFWLLVLLSAFIGFSQTKRTYESRAKLLVLQGTEALGKAGYVNGRVLQQREQQIHNEQQILESHQVMLTAAHWILGSASQSAPPPLTSPGTIEEVRRFLTFQDTPPSLLQRISRTFGSLFGRNKIRQEPVEAVARELSDNLSAKVLLDSDTLDVTFTYRDPRVAQTALKLILAAYMNHHVAVFQNTRESDLLKSQLDHAVDKYHQQLAKLSSYMNAHRVYNDDSQLTVLFSNRGKLEQDFNEAMADNVAALVRMASLGGIANSIARFERYSTTEVRNKLRDDLEGKLNEASLEEKTLLNRHPEGSRAYKEQQAKLEEIRRLMFQEQGRVVDQTDTRRTKASELVESEVINVTEAQRGLQAKVDQLRGNLHKLDSEISSYATSLPGFDSLKLDLNLARQESEQMAQVYLQSRLQALTAEKSITDISVIDNPTVDPEPSSPNGKLFAAATLLLLGFGTPALLFGAIILDPAVGGDGVAESQLGTPVAATFPLMDMASGTDAVNRLCRENKSEFARLYQFLKDRGDQGSVVLLTQANAGAGGSLLGYSLAKVLGRFSRKKTAFIDRTEHSIDESYPASFFKAKGMPPVLKLPGDEPDGTPADPVAHLTRLREEYAYVVIATGAVGTADLFAISGAACSTFLVLEPGKSNRNSARNGLELLRQFGFSGTQLILNKRITNLPDWITRRM